MMKTRKGYPVYPLTVAQKFHLYYLPFCPNAAVLNIGTSLTIGTDLDWDVLRESIYKAYERNEGMRIRFAKDKEGNVYQYVVSAEQDRKEREIEFVDFSNVTMEEAADTMQKWTTVPFPLEDSPMTKIKMIRTSDGFNGVYFLGHHMVVNVTSYQQRLPVLFGFQHSCQFSGESCLTGTLQTGHQNNGRFGVNVDFRSFAPHELG